METDNVCIGLTDLVHDAVGTISEVEVAMLDILEHEIFRIAVRQDVIGKYLELKGVRASCCRGLVYRLILD